MIKPSLFPSPNTDPYSPDYRKDKRELKYRPYLSLAELNALLNCIDGDFSSGKTALLTAKRSLQKMKLSAEMEIATSAYKTNPRPTMEEKLGFPTMHKQSDAPIDFDAMLNEIAGGSNTGDNINQSEEIIDDNSK